jgi:hypothetical protein
MIRKVRITPSCSDGDAFSRNEVVTIELEAGLIIIRALDVIIERPAASAAMHKMP